MRKLTLDGRDYVLVPREQWEAMNRRGATPSAKQPARLAGAASEATFGLHDVRMSLARKMAARRKAAGLTQAQLARLARVRVETISRLENGLHMPGIQTFDRIDRALSRRAKRPAE